MVDISSYLTLLLARLQEQFAGRLLYVGLQGSYLRDEATEHSDIDIMVVIDALCVSDLDIYRTIINSLPYADKSCGFICSKADLAAWNPLEIWNLLSGTQDIYRELRPLVPVYTDQDIRNYIKMSLNNLYHELCHRYIHAGSARSAAALPGAYKGAFFILQGVHYLRTAHYAATRTALLSLLSGKDHAVLSRAMAYSRGECPDFPESFQLLFTWCQETLQSI